MVLKYIVEQYEFETMYFGIANVVANSMIMLRYVVHCPAVVWKFRVNVATGGSSSIVLWVSQNMEDDYTYRLSL